MGFALRHKEGVVTQRRPDRALPEEKPSGKPSVCFVAPYLWPVLSRDARIAVVGGAEVQQAVLARLLAARGYRVTAVTHDYGQPDGAEVDGVRVFKCFRPDAGVPVLRFLHPRLTTMLGALGRANADIYYQRSSALWTGVVAEYARRYRRRSVYAGASDRDFMRGKEQIRYGRDRWLYHRGLARVDAIVAQNEHQLRSCRDYHNRDAVLIPSTYELPKSTSMKDEGLVLWVGTIHEYKRPELFLDLARRLPQYRFAMIGGPSAGGERLKPGYFESIRERAAALPNLEFTGFLPLAEVETWFDRARVLVSTSVFEGMPNVFLQAWARGIPTIATVDVGVAAHTVISGVEEGVAHLQTLLGHDALWLRASRRVRAYFDETHGADAVMAKYEDLFDRLSRR